MNRWKKIKSTVRKYEDSQILCRVCHYKAKTIASMLEHLDDECHQSKLITRLRNLVIQSSKFERNKIGSFQMIINRKLKNAAELELINGSRNRRLIIIKKLLLRKYVYFRENLRKIKKFKNNLIINEKTNHFLLIFDEKERKKKKKKKKKNCNKRVNNLMRSLLASEFEIIEEIRRENNREAKLINSSGSERTRTSGEDAQQQQQISICKNKRDDNCDEELMMKAAEKTISGEFDCDYDESDAIDAESRRKEATNQIEIINIFKPSKNRK